MRSGRRGGKTNLRPRSWTLRAASATNPGLGTWVSPEPGPCLHHRARGHGPSARPRGHRELELVHDRRSTSRSRRCRRAVAVPSAPRLARSRCYLIGIGARSRRADAASQRRLLSPRLGRPAPVRARPRAERPDVRCGAHPSPPRSGSGETTDVGDGVRHRSCADRSRRASPSRGGRRPQAFPSGDDLTAPRPTRDCVLPRCPDRSARELHDQTPRQLTFAVRAIWSG